MEIAMTVHDLCPSTQRTQRDDMRVQALQDCQHLMPHLIGHPFVPRAVSRAQRAEGRERAVKVKRPQMLEPAFHRQAPRDLVLCGSWRWRLAHSCAQKRRAHSFCPQRPAQLKRGPHVPNNLHRLSQAPLRLLQQCSWVAAAAARRQARLV